MASPQPPASLPGAAASTVKIAPGAIVCNECELVGDITIGPRTVIHPKARIVAEAGPIVMGENNLVEEQAQILHLKASGAAEEVMTIGCNNVFEVGCVCEAAKIGDHNVLEAKSRVGPTTRLSNGCVIGAACEMTPAETLPENTVVYGAGCKRRVQGERPAPQTLQLDFLTKILPNYHHLKKPTKTKA